MSSGSLQKPLSKGRLKLSHRVVLAPMTRMRASDSSGVPSPWAETYYSERTSPGSLLITEGTVIHPRGKGFPKTPGIWTQEQAAGWKRVTDAVHARGGTIFVQIWHVGRVSVPSQTEGLPPLAASVQPLAGEHLLLGDDNATEPYVPSQEMSLQDIKEVVEQFAHAARLAVEVAGFDGVEIHGTNGYLLDTFIHDNINSRVDEYGGSIENKLRFPLAVVDAVIAAIGQDRTAIRIAPYHVLQETFDSNRVATFSAICEQLEKRQLAYVHLVEPRYDLLSLEGAFSGDIDRDETNRMAETASLWPFRRLLKTTTVVGAGGYSAESASQAIAEGRIDLAAFGRYFTSNPDLPERLFNGYPLTKYHRPTFYTGGSEGYLGWAAHGKGEAGKATP